MNLLRKASALLEETQAHFYSDWATFALEAFDDVLLALQKNSALHCCFMLFAKVVLCSFFGFCSAFLLNEGTAIVLKQSFLKLGGRVRFSLNKGTDGGAIAVTESSVVRDMQRTRESAASY